MCSHIFPAGVLFTHVGDCPVGVRKRWSTHRYPLLSHCLISAVGRQLKLVPAGGILPGKCWLPASHCSGGPPPAFTHEATSIRTSKPKRGIQSTAENKCSHPKTILLILSRLCMCECRPVISTQSHTVLNKRSPEQADLVRRA